MEDQPITISGLTIYGWAGGLGKILALLRDFVMHRGCSWRVAPIDIERLLVVAVALKKHISTDRTF
uniref:hypothetical protein n=1 Tax=Herbaspirillum lusitanum TaxID=213312 RepID=UPI00058FA9A2